MSDDWIVVLEAAADAPVGVGDLERLLAGLTDWYPSALHAEDRYAVQLVVAATTPDLALSTGLDLWRGAALRAGLPRCPVVRAEVKTPAELAAEHECALMLPAMAALDADAIVAAYQATRRLVEARRRPFGSRTKSVRRGRRPSPSGAPWPADSPKPTTWLPSPTRSRCWPVDGR